LIQFDIYLITLLFMFLHWCTMVNVYFYSLHIILLYIVCSKGIDLNWIRRSRIEYNVLYLINTVLSVKLYCKRIYSRNCIVWNRFPKWQCLFILYKWFCSFSYSSNATNPCTKYYRNDFSPLTYQTHDTCPFTYHTNNKQSLYTYQWHQSHYTYQWHQSLYTYQWHKSHYTYQWHQSLYTYQWHQSHYTYK
jgi:hypothetical protein